MVLEVAEAILALPGSTRQIAVLVTLASFIEMLAVSVQCFVQGASLGLGEILRDHIFLDRLNGFRPPPSPERTNGLFDRLTDFGLDSVTKKTISRVLELRLHNLDGYAPGLQLQDGGNVFCRLGGFRLGRSIERLTFGAATGGVGSVDPNRWVSADMDRRRAAIGRRSDPDRRGGRRIAVGKRLDAGARWRCCRLEWSGFCHSPAIRANQYSHRGRRWQRLCRLS